jgi:hypothetical protein
MHLAEGLYAAHMRLEATEAVPASIASGARRLFRPGAHAGTATHALLERLVGSLRFDSAARRAVSGARQRDERTTRQLVFEAGLFELELQTRAAHAGWSVSGLLLGPTAATSGEVRLIGSLASAQSVLGETLEFSLPVVPPGRYRLELLVDETTQVEVESLELGL